MDNGGITPVMPIGNNGYGDFGGGGFWIFALLILAMMGNNGFGWGNNKFANAIGYENLATSNEVQRGFDNQNSMANQREILSAVNAGTAQSVAATNQTFHDTLGIIQNRYDELARDISGLAVGQANQLAKSQECCCETKMLIQQTAADNALQMSQMEARLNAKMDANEIQNLRDKVSALELGAATSNVVRYPSNTFYAVPSPCFNTCGCANI